MSEVQFSSPEIEFICGPQIISGSDSFAAFFDQVSIDKGIQHGVTFPAQRGAMDWDAFLNANYYDQALCQYINFFRTGDPAFQGYARKIADCWWAEVALNGNQTVDNFNSPRLLSLSGLILRALDGRPDYWPWITQFTRDLFQIWVGARVTYPQLYYGARDGGYMLLYAAYLAKVHPDPAIRQEFFDKAFYAAVHYYTRVQSADGGWYWGDPDSVPTRTYTDTNGNSITVQNPTFGQPFHIGILLEGMVAVHKLTNNSTVKYSILKAIDWAWAKGYELNGWRAMRYFVWEAGPQDDRTGFPPSDPNVVRDARQLNATIVHTFGYAAFLNTENLTRFNEIWDSCYGKSDSYYTLIDYREKEYDQCCRAGGKALAYKTGAGVILPAPMPDPPVQITPPPPPAGNTMYVSGRVLKDGTGLMGEVVTLTDINGDPIGAATSNAQGGYQFEINSGQKGTIKGPSGSTPASYSFDGSVALTNQDFTIGSVPPVVPITRQGKWPAKDADKDKEIAAQWKEGYRLMKTDITGPVAIFEKVK